MPKRLLVADIGGTNARLELWEWREVAMGGGLDPGTDRPPPLSAFTLRHGQIYASALFSGLAALACTFLRDAGLSELEQGAIQGCCVAVCGPVANEDYMCGPVLPEQPPTQWNARAADLTTGALRGVIEQACLVNDFVAVGLGITAVDPNDVTILRAIPPTPRAPLACIGAGTGLGEVFLTWQMDANHPDGGYYQAWPSEGGMTEFAAHTEEEWRLREYIREHVTVGHVTVEGVVSGPGLANVYTFLQHVAQAPALATSTEKPLQHIVTEQALKGEPFCLRALDIMLRAWAAECRQAALRTLPFGGLYMAGGLANKLDARIRAIVPDEFVNDQVMGEFLQTIPLMSIRNENVGLLGARVRAHRMLF